MKSFSHNRRRLTSKVHSVFNCAEYFG